MAEVRTTSTVPVTANFAGIGAYTPCSPLLYVESTGDLYVLINPDQVVKIGPTAAVTGSTDIIQAQVFGPHIVQPLQTSTSSSTASITIEDASLQIGNRTYATPQAMYQDVGDANMQLAVRIFQRPIPPSPPVSNTNEQLGNQIFSRHPGDTKDVSDGNVQLANRAFAKQVALNPPSNSTEQIGTQVFGPHIITWPNDAGNANAQLANRSFAQKQPIQPSVNTNEQLGTQVFARHVVPEPKDLGDVNDQLSHRSFGTRYFPSPATVLASVNTDDVSLQLAGRAFKETQLFAPLDVANANEMLAARSYGWRYFSAPVVTVYSTVNPEDSQLHYAVRTYDRAPQVAALGDANDMIRGQAFSQRAFSAPMTFATNFSQVRSFRPAQLPAMWS